MKHRLHLIVGARPNFVKIGPLYHALKNEPWCEPRIIHTGQHYDRNMSESLFEDLGMPTPHEALGIGSGSPAEQTARIMLAYEPICNRDRPSLVIVAGDVNSTLACALTAKKQDLLVAHLEAGLRSRDRQMPEELNRILTDQLADFLWTPSPDANENLAKEGIPASRIFHVGNIMIDAFEMLRSKIEQTSLPPAIKNLEEGTDFAVVTLHRPSNVDHKDTLKGILDGLFQLAATMPLIFPLHPRTRKNLVEFGFWSSLEKQKRILVVDPMNYIGFMRLVTRARLVITDSGGIQEETTYLGIPCCTVRENTERPITVTHGTNRLVPPHHLYESAVSALAERRGPHERIELWDGHTALRIRDLLRDVHLQ